MIYDKHNLIHIGATKTATVSIFSLIHGIKPHDDMKKMKIKQPHFYNKNLNQIGEKNEKYSYYKHGHHTYVDYINFIKKYDEYKNYSFFSFVRNPYDRIVSIFFYHYVDRKRGDDSKKSLLKYLLDEKKSPSLITQTSYLKNSDGEISLDFIGKIENFKNDWEVLSSNYPTLPKYDEKYRCVNKSNRPKQHWSKFFNSEIKKVVDKMYHDDFINFNYNKTL